MQFINPIWLWGLTGLLIPIGIHLLSRKEGKIIRIGSTRFLTETATAQFKSIKLNELLLLALRCLFLTLIIFFIAGARCTSLKKNKKSWLVIEKGVENSDPYKDLIRSAARKDFEVHYLAEDFPGADDSLHVKPIDDYWHLAEDLVKKDLDSVVVISYSKMKSFKGNRITPPSNILWLTAEPEETKSIMEAIEVSEDSLWITEGNYTSMLTEFQTSIKRKNESQTFKTSARDTINITLVVGAGFEADAAIIKASLKAIQEITPHLLVIAESKEHASSPKSGWTFWLLDKPLPTNIDNKIIAYSKCSTKNRSLLQKGNSICSNENADWIFTKRLNVEEALNANLTLRLAEILLEQKTDVNDQRVMPEQMLWSSSETKKETKVYTGTDIDQYLVFLILFTLVLERFIAYRKNQ